MEGQESSTVHFVKALSELVDGLVREVACHAEGRVGDLVSTSAHKVHALSIFVFAFLLSTPSVSLADKEFSSLKGV
jgi:hypothetical protein